MRGRFITGLLIFLLSNCTFAQVNAGARQIAISNSDVAQCNDVFSLFNNPAGLSQLNWREIGLYYSPSPFGLKELANGFFSYLEPTRYGAIAVGAMTYGFELYKENEICLGYSNRFEKNFFAGIAINYNNVFIKNYGNDNSISINLGCLVYLIDNLTWGFSYHNIARASYGKEKNQIPIVFQTGISYSPISNATLHGAIEKELEYPLSIRFGLEYFPIKYFYLRTGFSTEPDKVSGGIGIIYSFFELDYAVFNHQELGLTHQAGIIINFSGDEPRTAKIKKYLGVEE
jgi:hypothetical protein